MTEPDDLLLPAGTRLVHIGPPKTGTTAIQRALNNARDDLRDHGICFPGKAARPREAGWAVVGAGVPRGRPKPTMEPWHDLVREVDAAGDRRVVVSNESFAVGYYKAVREIVAGLGGDRIHIVYVVRRIDKLLNSHWQQRVQAGLTLPYDDWLRHALGEPDRQDRHWRGFWRHHSLPDVMNRWLGAAGADKITLVVADESDPDLLPRLFERFLGLPPGFLKLERDPANRSLSLNEIEMVRHLHRLGVEREWSDQVLRHLVQFGVIRGLAHSSRRPDDGRIVLPSWAAKRAAEINDERIDLVRSLGVRVIGDPERLRSPAAEGDQVTEPGDVRIAPEVAASAIAGAVDAGERRRLFAVETAEREVSKARADLERQAEESDDAAEPEPSERRNVEDMTSRELLAIVRARALRRMGPG